MSQTKKKPVRLTAALDMVRMLSVTWLEMGLLILQILVYAVLEGIGVTLLSPVLSYVQDPTVISRPTGLWKYLIGGTEYFNVPLNLLTLLLLAFFPILLKQFVYFLNQWYLARVQQRAVTRLRADGLDAIMHSDLAFVVREGQGKLVSILHSQVSRAGLAIVQFVRQVASAMIIVVYVSALIYLSPELALMAVVALGFIALIVKSNITRSRAYGAEAATRGNAAVTALTERMGAIRLIKMRGQEDVEATRLTNVVRDLELTMVKISVARAAVEITVDPALMLAMFAIVFVGVQSLGVTLASLGLFMFILLRLNGQAKDFNVGRQTFSSNYDSLLMVHDLIDRARKARTIVGGTREFDGLKRTIEFQDVSFSYQDADDDGSMVLSHVSVVIPRGGMYAFVGRSGAGKSTLVDLIPHLREATEGRILVDDVPLEEFDLRSLRRRIGFMTQDAVLFNDTLLGNLRYGLEHEPSEDDVQRALREAYCLDFVAELPDGLATNIGDRGVRLSGGQRQRLTLARVLLQDPDILILDEPTSALDSESEQYIQKALDEMRGKRTLIVIAHRLSTVQRADQILVVDQGVVVERGTHKELIAHDEAYRRLFELQINA